jgi:hypothetical protein
MVARVILSAILAMSAPAPTQAQPAPSLPPESATSPESVLGSIAARFHARPVPPFETYTLTRTQNTADGMLDVPNSYTVRSWVRTSDHTALTRTVMPDGTRGPLTFGRPAFNEARDPGPATADLLESASLPDYRVDAVETLGEVVHLRITPVRNLGRNRSREVFADRRTYELRKLIAADTLFIFRGPTYPVTLTITMGTVDGYPVIANVHGSVGGDYNGDGKEVDFTFSAIAFPSTLPDWYFDSRTYGRHGSDAPV